MLNKIISIILLIALPAYWGCASVTKTIDVNQINKSDLNYNKNDLQITLIDLTKYFLHKYYYHFKGDSLIYGYGWKNNQPSASLGTQVVIPIDSISYANTVDQELTTAGKIGLVIVAIGIGILIYFVIKEAIAGFKKKFSNEIGRALSDAFR
jgi:hypothetical protein